MDVVEQARELISFDTVSAHSNVVMGRRLVDAMEGLGCTVVVQKLTDTAGQEKHNIIGVLPDRDGRMEGGLALAGHTDTVPFRSDQKAHLHAFQEGGRLYGRGSCDMKGAIAAQLTAVSRLKGYSLKAPLSLIFTCDEEVGCLGAKALINTSLVKAGRAIIGEPTSLKPVRMHKGYCGLRVVLTGRAAHSSDPSRGVSAIKAATRVLMGLESLEERLKLQHYPEGDGLFDPDHATVNVGLLSAGVARNVVPETCTFTVELRALPRQDFDAILQEIGDVVHQAADLVGASVEITTVTRDAPMETSSTAPLVQFLEQSTGSRAGAVAFSTEGKEFNRMGIETVICGPGSIQRAHQEDEYCPLDELEQAVDLYSTAIRHFCL